MRTEAQNLPAATTRPGTGGVSIPRPSGIFDPVGRALDAIGDRWTLSLIRQLLLGPAGFQELRKRTGIAPRVLSGRLRQLVAGGLVEAVSPGVPTSGILFHTRSQMLDESKEAS